MDIKVAVLVDASFFLKRLNFFKRHYFPSEPELTPKQIVQVLNSCIRRHINDGNQSTYQHLYRVFYYDSPPLDIKVHYPLVNQGETKHRVLDFSKQPETIHRNEILRNNIAPSLHEHIDGLVSYDLVAILKDILGKLPTTTPAWWSNGTSPKKAKSQNRKK